MPTTTVTVPGARLHVVDDGNPAHPAVLLLHAGIVDLAAWDDLVPLLVAADYRVVRFDARGYGRTITEAVDFSNQDDTVAILDRLGIGRAVLVGNSRGGQIAFDTAIAYPDRVVAVVGVGAGFGGFDGQSTPEELATYDRMEALEARLEEVGPATDPAALDKLLDLEVRFWVDGPGQPTDRVASSVRERVRAMDHASYVPDRVQARPIPLAPPAADRIGDLRCPVLAVAGELDALDVAQTARYLAATAPDARAVIWPDVAHMIGMEAPDRLAALVVEFLAPFPRWS